jgi:hypothetical protein
VAKVWRFELVSLETYTGQEGISHVHYQTDVPVLGSEPSAATVLNAILNHFSSSGHNLSVWALCMYSNAKLTQARVREEVEPNSGDVPAVAQEALSIVGSLGSAGTSHLPSGLAMWQHYGTDAAVRSGRGGTHQPHIANVATLDDTGHFLSTTAVWTNSVALGVKIADVIDNVFSETGDLKPGIYSRTRRARQVDPWFFDLTSAAPSTRPRWLTRRAE